MASSGDEFNFDSYWRVFLNKCPRGGREITNAIKKTTKETGVTRNQVIREALVGVSVGAIGTRFWDKIVRKHPETT